MAAYFHPHWVRNPKAMRRRVADMHRIYRDALSRPERRAVVSALLRTPHRTAAELEGLATGSARSVVDRLYGSVIASHDASASTPLFYLDSNFVSWLAMTAVEATSTPLPVTSVLPFSGAPLRLSAAASARRASDEEEEEEEEDEVDDNDEDEEELQATPFPCNHDFGDRGAVVFIDLDHQGHAVSADGSVEMPPELGENTLVVGVCGKGYRGREPAILFKANADVKNAADYLLTCIVTDWIVRGLLTSRPVFIVSRDASLANISVIAADYYDKHDVVTVPAIGEISNAILRWRRTSRRRRV